MNWIINVILFSLHTFNHVSQALKGHGIKQAEKRQFDSIVSIGSRSNRATSLDGSGHFCGGTLITRKHILTAAHCLEYRPICDLEVGIGDVDLKNLVLYDVKWGIVYNEWAKQKHMSLASNDHDIGILKLFKPISKSITLAKLTDKEYEDFYEKQAITAGWGTANNKQFPRFMGFVSVRVINHDECYRTLRIANRIPESEELFDENFLCTGAHPYAMTDSGDSGGPLFINGNELIGINSAVYPDNLKNPKVELRSIRNIHAGVAYYKHFINDVITKESKTKCIGCFG